MIKRDTAHIGETVVYGYYRQDGITFREAVCKDMEFMGIKFDAEKNNCRGKEVVISTPDSKVTVMVVPTDEEMAIARDTKRCVEEAGK